MTGTWRAKIHTDPKSAAIAQASFLVEDFVPERLDLKLEPAVQALSPQEPGTIKLAGRYLYGPPAAGLAVEGEIAVKLAKGDLPGFAGYKFGLADEQVAPVRKPLEGLPATDAEGKADIAVLLPALPKTSRPLEADVILKLQGVRRAHHRAHRHAARRPEGAARRHQAAVQGRPGRGRRARALRGDRARGRRQGRRGQGPQVGADAPREPLAVVQPRRLVELRVRRPARAASPPAPPTPPPARRPRSRPRSTGAAIASRSARPTAPASSSPAWCSAPATTPTRPPTAPRCSTSPSTSRPTRRARPRASRSPRAWPAARSSP